VGQVGRMSVWGRRLRLPSVAYISVQVSRYGSPEGAIRGGQSDVKFRAGQNALTPNGDSRPGGTPEDARQISENKGPQLGASSFGLVARGPLPSRARKQAVTCGRLGRCS
jgi:hypothetical protein